MFECHSLGGGLRVESRRLEVRASCRIGCDGWKRWTGQRPAHTERLARTHAEQGFQLTDERNFACIELADFHGKAGGLQFRLAGIERRTLALRRHSGEEIGELLGNADLLAQQFAALAGGQQFHHRLAGLADELALDLADFRFGRLQFGERDILFQLQAVRDRKTLGEADFEPALGVAGVVFECCVKIRIRESAGLVHAPECFLDAQARSRKVGVLGADTVADG